MSAPVQHHLTTQEILRLFGERGDSQYGKEAVTQREHGLQAAFFAERARSSAALIVASLLHDVGHLLHQLPEDAPEQGIDDEHEALAARWLADRFDDRVVEPVELHVAAKRYLCTIDPEYIKRLSIPSRRSFELQGGAMSGKELAAFRARKYFEEAVQLRQFDDAAKVPQLETPTLEYFAQYIDDVLANSTDRR